MLLCDFLMNFILSMTNYVNLPVFCIQIRMFWVSRPPSVSHRHGSEDPDPYPDPYQYVRDLQHCFKIILYGSFNLLLFCIFRCSTFFRNLYSNFVFFFTFSLSFLSFFSFIVYRSSTNSFRFVAFWFSLFWGRLILTKYCTGRGW